MKKISHILILLFLVTSCNCNKKATKKEKKIIPEGFKKAIVIKTDSNDLCKVKLQIEGEQNDQYFDPINLKDFYKSSKKIIWIKYVRLRMKNRCPNMQPIRITETFNNTNDK